MILVEMSPDESVQVSTSMLDDDIVDRISRIRGGPVIDEEVTVITGRQRLVVDLRPSVADYVTVTRATGIAAARRG